MIGFLRNWRNRRILARERIPESLWHECSAQLPLLKGLEAIEQTRLRELTTLFLHEKRFEGAQGALPDEVTNLWIAVQACVPILNLGLEWYRGWTTIILYPDEFIARREDEDEAGVVHIRREVMSGETWDQGGVILSLADVAASGLCEGYNVVIHELAHKIDMLNGDADGFPPLHRNMGAIAWHDDFRAAFDHLRARCDAGEEPAIDPYAAENPAECFAVFSEYFFESPALLVAHYPGVYRQLKQFYRQDPLARAAT